MKPDTKRARRLLLAAAAAGGLLALAACERSSTETVREVGLRVAGLYRNPDGPLVERNSGAPVRRLQLRQDGDRLAGVDNNGVPFEGRISHVSGRRASVSLRGATTTGESVTIVGDITVNGSEAVFLATWIEPAFHRALYGEATVEGAAAPPAQGGAQ